MKKSIVSCIPFALFVALLVGCGDESTTEVTQVVGMQVLENGDALPKCGKENEGAMLYSLDSAAVYYCVNRQWILMAGENGEADNSGSVAADGKDGASCTAKALKNGKGYKIVCGGDSVGVVLNGKDGAKGDPGPAGAAGASCTAKALKNDKGYKIVCDGDSVGVVLNGENGLKGDTGHVSLTSTSCDVVDSGNGLVSVSCGESSSPVILYKALCGSTPYDPEKLLCDMRDNQLYRFVLIESQVWMAENLNYRYVQRTDGGAKEDSSSYCFDNDSDKCSEYGRLYLWSAAMDSAGVYGGFADGCGFGTRCSPSGKVRGVCPAGWHLPDSTEWVALFEAVGGIAKAGKKLKSKSGWKDYYEDSGNGTDKYSFTALAVGHKTSGEFAFLGEQTCFWSSNENSKGIAYCMGFYNDDETVYINPYSKASAYSVRCVKD